MLDPREGRSLARGDQFLFRQCPKAEKELTASPLSYRDEMFTSYPSQILVLERFSGEHLLIVGPSTPPALSPSFFKFGISSSRYSYPRRSRNPDRRKKNSYFSFVYHFCLSDRALRSFCSRVSSSPLCALLGLRFSRVQG